MRNLEDVDRLPKVTRKNVLILKYYSFENYFFNPAVMARLGIVKRGCFYRTLWQMEEHLYRIRSGQQLMKSWDGISSPEDMKEHMEEVRTFLREAIIYMIYFTARSGQGKRDSEGLHRPGAQGGF